MYDFSVFLAGIRPQNWQALYDSIKACTSKTFELIFVGPYGLPDSLKDNPDVKFVQDYGCPSRCYQLGLLACTAPYVVWAADDGVFLNNEAIDKAFSLIHEEKDVVSLRYYEGPIEEDGDISKLAYWTIGGHGSLKRLGIPKHFFLVMNALVSREYMIEIGGWDCRFKHIAFGSNDLAIRMQKDGANVILGDYFMHVNFTPGHTGDHAPIHDSHCEEDFPLFKSIYRSSEERTKIDVNNWKDVPGVWERRFGK